ncbi:MAG TPA: MmcQ/YjbR family DNA-binding protein [Solirubrobacteraceae bacterium]|nr:MmcQ/YjbR family DNA-binding protein [Solirubrobacteraceae bacterium]
MASWDDVRRIALALPETAEASSYGHPSWQVRAKSFVWERPLRGSDLRALGDDAPAGAILAARVEHLVARDALLANDPDVYFTTPHFEGFAAVLVRLDEIGVDDLEELIVEGWLARAPKRLARAYLEAKLPPTGA